MEAKEAEQEQEQVQEQVQVHDSLRGRQHGFFRKDVFFVGESVSFLLCRLRAGAGEKVLLRKTADGMLRHGKTGRERPKKHLLT